MRAGVLVSVQESSCYSRVPFRDKHCCLAGCIEAVPPTSRALNGERALVVAAVNVTISTDILTIRPRVAQFRLRKDSNILPMMGCDRLHKRFLFLPHVARSPLLPTLF